MAGYRSRSRLDERPSLFDDESIRAAVRGVSRNLLRRIHALSIVEAGRRFGREPQATRAEIENVRRESSLGRLAFLVDMAREKNVPFERAAASYLAEWERFHELRVVPQGNNRFGLEPFQIDAIAAEVKTPALLSVSSAGVPDEHSSTARNTERNVQPKPRKRERVFKGPGDGLQWDIPLGEPTFGGG